jgi:hypothetical protein
MTIQNAYSFLVHPGKHEDEQRPIRGARISLSGEVFDLLDTLYVKAESDSPVELMFSAAADGTPENQRRTQIVDYLTSPTLANAKHLASALQQVTDKRSRLGLFFIARGTDGASERIMLYRFPADEGIVANEDERRFTVEYLKQVFLKNAHSYKSATFSGASFDNGEFWTGRAVDRQLKPGHDLPHYWIADFLQAQLLSTPAAGTKRLAVALSTAIRDTSDVTVRGELVAFSTLLRNKDGHRISPERAAAEMLSPPATEAFRQAMPRPEVFAEPFELSASELTTQLTDRQVELDNGAILMAENTRFDQVFTIEPSLTPSVARYSTTGYVVSATMRKRK